MIAARRTAPTLPLEGLFVLWALPLQRAASRVVLRAEFSCQEFCRRGVGRQMIAKLVGKLSNQRRNRIALYVRETNLQAQLFFRVLGFRAMEVVREHYPDTGEDAYSMQYHLDESMIEVDRPTNRIAKQYGT